MKKYLSSIILVLFITTFMHAQQQQGKSKGGDRREAMMNHMTEELQLDDTQRIGLEKVMNESMKQRKELRDQDIPREEKRDALMSIAENENAEAAKILNETQYQDFIALKKEMRQKGMERKKGRGK